MADGERFTDKSNRGLPDKSEGKNGHSNGLGDVGVFDQRNDVTREKTTIIYNRSRGFDPRYFRLGEVIYKGVFSHVCKSYHKQEVIAAWICPRRHVPQDFSNLLRLRSPLISRIILCMEGGKNLWVIMKHLPNGDLGSILQRDADRRLFGEVHSQFLVAGLLVALEYLHSNHVVHGNIKPSKILIDKAGYPVLTGYITGHCKDFKQDGTNRSTLQYCPPERIRYNMMDYPGDVFSVGCVAYEIITGITPFDGGSNAQTRKRILDRKLKPKYDVELFSFAGELFINKCLRKCAPDRFRIGLDMKNVCREEWFSCLPVQAVKRQKYPSPILHVRGTKWYVFVMISPPYQHAPLDQLVSQDKNELIDITGSLVKVISGRNNWAKVGNKCLGDQLWKSKKILTEYGHQDRHNGRAGRKANPLQLGPCDGHDVTLSGHYVDR